MASTAALFSQEMGTRRRGAAEEGNRQDAKTPRKVLRAEGALFVVRVGYAFAAKFPFGLLATWRLGG
jgi:hypothetical protein